MVASGVGLALDPHACVEILRECGFLRKGGCRCVNLLDIPKGLNAEATARYLRENGAEICR
jgi:hypothetical protein